MQCTVSSSLISSVFWRVLPVGTAERCEISWEKIQVKADEENLERQLSAPFPREARPESLQYSTAYFIFWWYSGVEACSTLCTHGERTTI